ncbi:hemin receptor [Thalassococcus sp. CAU 1522]|uniref:Hemin receptor n=1 Tax=Thalassococcus arenae TaxID=2851652 RepID=A0ABS6N330_9RHOB|nr:globin domain-containing protein [Thalassococcus arenae]MBV2358429.1 hemin receptor [Thalassococcus arenae]
MTDIERIRATWARAAADPGATAAGFYTNLFKIAPQTRALFGTDLTVQGAKLMQTIGFIVDHLDDGDAWQGAARELAIRHVAYGVKPQDYGPVGEALVMTLSETLGEDFDQADREVWSRTYAALSNLMTKAAF